MLTSHDLETIGKELSQKYIEDETALNESLSKVASEHSLNKQQINRIAECANVETYLGLMKTSSDKYINFDLADSRAVHEKVASVYTPSETTSDYDSEPDKPINESVFDLYKGYYGEESFDKKASASRSESEVRQELAELHGTLEFLDNNMRESYVDIESTYEKIAYAIKQEVLDHTPFNNIKHILEYASPGVGPKIAENIQEKFAQLYPHVDLEKEASFKGDPNPESDIYKYTKEIEKDAERVNKIYDAITLYTEKYTKLAEENELPVMYKKAGFVGSVGRGIVNFFRKFKFLGGATVGATIGYTAGKDKGKKEQGSLLKHYYEERKPKAGQPVFRRVN